MAKRLKLLWVGDAGCETGFARCTHSILDVVRHHFDVSVLALNYRGDPNPFQKLYDMYPAGPNFGLLRLTDVVDVLQPDIIVVQQDTWNIPAYVKGIRAAKSFKGLIVGVLAVDGKNVRGTWCNDLDLGIFWTQFGLTEAIKGGFAKPGVVIGLGIDQTQFYEADQVSARNMCDVVPPEAVDGFIVGSMGRNQPRKRLDLVIRAFAQFYQRGENQWLLLHAAPTGDQGYDLKQLAYYYGIGDRLLLSEPDVGRGVNEEHMRLMYSILDVQLSLPQGEGWGLMIMEGMACRRAQIVNGWSALGEWAKDAALVVPCCDEAVTPSMINTIGGVADVHAAAQALHMLQTRDFIREDRADAGLALVSQPQFSWPVIGQQYVDALYRCDSSHNFKLSLVRADDMRDTEAVV
jgi:glycosyltransferase involved in cell wall biosynthesis